MEIPELENFSELEKFLQESELTYPQALLEYYQDLGQQMGFTCRENFSVIKYALNLGKLGLLWVEPKVTFTFEFSSLENLFKELVKISEFSPDLAVLVLSSKSTHCKLKDVKKFIEESTLFSQQKFCLLDLAEKEVIKL